MIVSAAPNSNRNVSWLGVPSAVHAACTTKFIARPEGCTSSTDVTAQLRFCAGMSSRSAVSV
jgi:hypothetical protein